MAGDKSPLDFFNIHYSTEFLVRKSSNVFICASIPEIELTLHSLIFEFKSFNVFLEFAEFMKRKNIFWEINIIFIEGRILAIGFGDGTNPYYWCLVHNINLDVLKQINKDPLLQKEFKGLLLNKRNQKSFMKDYSLDEEKDYFFTTILGN